MNKQRMIILGLAGVAAIVVALLVRALVGGGTQKVEAAAPAPKIAMAHVLVASQALQPGQTLSPAQVRWQDWPAHSVDSSFITETNTPSIATAVQGTVVRAPLVEGEPLTTAKIVRSDSAGFMAATLEPGARAVSIGISVESGAGGFILPNDRVDVILTTQIGQSQHAFRSRTILSNVRVLAVDQTYTQDKDQRVVLAKTATLELAPDQAEIVARAQASGTLSLSLRPLGENGSADHTVAGNKRPAESGDVQVIRYGIASNSSQSN